MVERGLIEAHLGRCLDDAQFLGLPGFRRGKVRDTFDLGAKLVLVTTDRQSAFDRILASIPFKGQVLNQVSAFWFGQTRDIVENHVLEIPDPNVTVGKRCRVIPVEFVVRGYLTGSTDTSIWTQYNRGVRSYCGHVLPDGMRKNQKLEKNIITPTTKDELHDALISAEEVVGRGILDPKTWARLSEIVLALFARGQEIAAAHGLILVDTKYELGFDEAGKVMLIDEIHTPDSSRYWLKDSYSARLADGLEPENIDKEFLRLWFRKNCDPYKDPVLPPAPKELVVELSSRYIQLFEMITGLSFKPEVNGAVQERLARNLAKYRT